MSYADTDRLYDKFVVFLREGQPLPHPPVHGGEHGWFAYRTQDRTYHLPIDGPYFVLAYGRDPHARTALAVYADSVETELPHLAHQLRTEIDRWDRATQ